MKKLSFVFLIVLFGMQSCHYRPFLKYYFPSKKTHLAKFSKWEQHIGSPSNPLRACYDVTCYDWLVSVHPEKKSINGLMKIYFRMDLAQDSLMLDLQTHLKIDGVKSSVSLKKWKRKKDVLFFVFDRNLQKGESAVIEIAYHGTPVSLLGESAINWKKDKNNKAWVCSATEGIGPHHMMPCKMLLNDEPDSCFIRVAVPKDLVAVANGKLDGITETGTEKIYNWSVKNPINIYNISFNTGDYVKLEKDYKDINNIDRKIYVYALSYNKTVADTFYDQAPVMMKNFERLYGPYPWWNDECKFIESCLPNSAMEHQSAISMGEGYVYNHRKINVTLAHELSHEWWGNNITGYDYADIWLHEGFASYSEFLMAEAIYGKKDYDLFARYYSKNVRNKRPVLKPYNVVYDSWVHDEDQDIYDKGAMLLHTLRMQLDQDELFFKVLKNAQVKFAKSNITVAQFISYFNAETKTDFTPYFDLYLKQLSPPELEYRIDKTDAETAVLNYRWAKELTPGFSMKVIADVGDTPMVIYPTDKWQQLKFPAKEVLSFDIAKFGYVLLKVAGSKS